MEELWQKLHVVKDVLYPLNYNIEKNYCNLPTSLNFLKILLHWLSLQNDSSICILSDFDKYMLILIQDSHSVPVSHMLSSWCQDCLPWPHTEPDKDCIIYT